MPTKHKNPSFYTTPEELESLQQSAVKAEMSLSNYIRQQLGLEKLKHGGARIKTDKPNERQPKRKDR